MADGLIVDRPTEPSGRPSPGRPPAQRPTGSRLPGRLFDRGALTGLRLGYRMTPWWARVLAVFGLSRIVSTALLVGFAKIQATNSWTVAHPDYASFAKIWDGHWYYIVAIVGYPKTLPEVVDGISLHVGQNQWAFLPVYPFVVRGLMALTGLPFASLAVVVSVLAAAGASLVFYRLMRRSLGESTSLFAVVLFCVSPLSPIFQVAYAESLFLLLIGSALLLLLRRQYWLMLGVIAIAAFTRPGVIAFALALGLHFVARWFARDRDPFPVRDRIVVAVSAGITALLGVAWPIVAGLVTGRPSAYTDTELSWRADYIGWGKLLPFTSWVQGANWWFPGGAGIVYLIVALVLFTLFLFSPWSRRLSLDLRLWVVAYVVYLLAVFFPQSSTWRILMPIFPLLGALAVPRSKLFRLGLVCLCIFGQFVWLYYCWWVNGYDWTPP